MNNLEELLKFVDHVRFFWSEQRYYYRIMKIACFL